MICQSPITLLSPNTLYMHLHNLLGDKLTMYQLPFYMINAPCSTGDRFMVQTGRGSGLRPWTCNPRVTYLTMRYSHWLSTRRSSLRVLLLALPCVYLKDELRREEARCKLTPKVSAKLAGQLLGMVWCSSSLYPPPPPPSIRSDVCTPSVCLLARAI